MFPTIDIGKKCCYHTDNLFTTYQQILTETAWIRILA